MAGDGVGTVVPTGVSPGRPGRYVLLATSEGAGTGCAASGGGSVETTTWTSAFRLLLRFSVTSAESESWLTVDPLF